MALETLPQSWSFYVVVIILDGRHTIQLQGLQQVSAQKDKTFCEIFISHDLKRTRVSPDTQWWIFVVEVRLRPEWLPSQGDASDSDVLLRQLLAADLRDACEGSLPRNLERQHNIHVEGTLVLESQSGGIFGYFILFYQVQDGWNC